MRREGCGGVRRAHTGKQKGARQGSGRRGERAATAWQVAAGRRRGRPRGGARGAHGAAWHGGAGQRGRGWHGLKAGAGPGRGRRREGTCGCAASLRRGPREVIRLLCARALVRPVPPFLASSPSMRPHAATFCLFFFFLCCLFTVFPCLCHRCRRRRLFLGLRSRGLTSKFRLRKLSV